MAESPVPGVGGQGQPNLTDSQRKQLRVLKAVYDNPSMTGTWRGEDCDALVARGYAQRHEAYPDIWIVSITPAGVGALATRTGATASSAPTTASTARTPMPDPVPGVEESQPRVVRANERCDCGHGRLMHVPNCHGFDGREQCQCQTFLLDWPEAEVNRLRAENEALRRLVTKAPHANHCDASSPLWPGACSCWKGEAELVAPALAGSPSPGPEDQA